MSPKLFPASTSKKELSGCKHPGKFEDGPRNFWLKCYPMDLFSVVDGYVGMLVRDAIKPSGDRQDHSGP